ncbi:hypothetical protein [Agrobacterium pusense]|uniref:hypothetical protein n=1 Tax=Agrobacterium pusense TaxID=648995 RepID=UPI001560792B|nr:hypothetical protein [Agrobacterium pusense]NRF12622.1 hypothetical protein [Agrobacterium pusense]
MAERKIAGMEIKVEAPLATDALRLQARLTRMLEAADAKLEDLIMGFSGAGNTPEERAKGLPPLSAPSAGFSARCLLMNTLLSLVTSLAWHKSAGRQASMIKPTWTVTSRRT